MIAQLTKERRLHRHSAFVPATVWFLSILLPGAICMPASAEQFAIKCAGGGFYYYVTFDTDLMKSIRQVEQGGTQKGPITSVTEDEIRFDMLMVGRPALKLIWSRHDNKITWLHRAESETTKLFATEDCERTEPRPVMPHYDLIAPYTAPLRPPK
jgi:hypothetical protein